MRLNVFIIYIQSTINVNICIYASRQIISTNYYEQLTTMFYYHFKKHNSQRVEGRNGTISGRRFRK